MSMFHGNMQMLHTSYVGFIGFTYCTVHVANIRHVFSWPTVPLLFPGPCDHLQDGASGLFVTALVLALVEAL